MSHEIEKNDGVVLHRERAWHGLGVIVEEAPTPREALNLAELDWEIEQRPLYVRDVNGNELKVPNHLANYRTDKDLLLGVVTDSYLPVSNGEMADFCESLTENNETVKCETAGSIRNGKRVWFLLKGAQFEVANGDQMFPYILVSNGHDGMTSFRVTPTTVRAVCSNTLHMVIPRAGSTELGKSAIRIGHFTNVMDRIAEARQALKYYSKTQEAMREAIDTLVAKDVTSEEVQTFFLECYTTDFGPVPTNPQDKKEERVRNRAMSAFDSFSKRFDDEKGIAGSSAWNMFNAYSGLIQHDRKAWGKNDADRIERRVESNLFGLNQSRSQDALQRAYRITM